MPRPLSAAEGKALLANLNRPATPGRPRRRGGRSAASGRVLESSIDVSGGGVVLIEKIPNGVRYIPGGGTRAMKTPYDYAGTILVDPHRGRSIVFDAKRTESPHGLEIANPRIVKPHQLAAIVAHGDAGAIAGILVERVAVGDYAWIDYAILRRWLSPGAPNLLRWDEVGYTVLGPNASGVPFDVLLKRYPAA